MPKRKKDVEFLGDSLTRLRDFPREAMREAGYQVDRVQSGLMPTHYRPMPTIGPGVMEIKIRDSSGAFRIFYVANRGDVLYILHCFQKKSQKTERQDIETGKHRYKDLPE